MRCEDHVRAVEPSGSPVSDETAFGHHFGQRGHPKVERVRQTGVDEHPAQRPAKQTLLDQPAQVPVGQAVGERLAAGEWKVTGEGEPVRERLIEMKLHTRTEPWPDSASNGGCRRLWMGA